MKKSFLVIVATVLAVMPAVAQFPTDYNNPIITGQPSLSITPDARGAAMGDAGVATNPDMNSQYWNPAKYAFMDMKGGINASYTPWLRKLGVTDIDLAYIEVICVGMLFLLKHPADNNVLQVLIKAHPVFDLCAGERHAVHVFLRRDIKFRNIFFNP